jgi:hypothetical protein
MSVRLIMCPSFAPFVCPCYSFAPLGAVAFGFCEGFSLSCYFLFSHFEHTLETQIHWFDIIFSFQVHYLLYLNYTTHDILVFCLFRNRQEQGVYRRFPSYQGVERIAVRYSFKRGDFMRYALIADLPM